MPTPAAPVLSQDAITSRSVRLVWTFVPGTTWAEVDRCSGAGCTSFVKIAEPGALFYSNGGLTSGATYRYRVRAVSNTDGPGEWSNILSVTTPAGNVGIVQYAFAMGSAGSFGRGEVVALSLMGSLESSLALLRVNGVVAVFVDFEGTVGECFAHDLRVRYRLGSATVLTGKIATSLECEHNPTAPSGWGCTNYCNLNQTVEMRGRLGSSDILTHTHAADGYLELKVNGSVVWRLDDIALGIQGTPAYGQIGLYPAGTYTTPGVGGDCTIEHGGLTAFYFNEFDEYGAVPTSKFDYTFASMTDADLFGPSAPWSRDNAGPGSIYAPTIWDGKLSDSAPETGFFRGRMTSKVFTPFPLIGPPIEFPLIGPPFDQSELCPCPAPPSPTDPRGAVPVLLPDIPPQVFCAGGGLVPTAADLVDSEVWWGL